MNNARRITLLGLVVFSFAVTSSVANDQTAGSNLFKSPRETLSLDQGWRFHLGDVTDTVDPSYDDHEWRRVDVPHDYVVEGTFDRTNPFVYPGMNTSWYSLHGFLPVQPAMYRKTISIPAEAKGKRLWLEFDGVFSNSRYWLNGRDIGSQYSGYTRSRFDITEAADYGGKNILVVRVDPRYDGWWYEGGGIYRHVRLVMVDPVHIAPDGVFVAPTVVDPGNGDPTSHEPEKGNKRSLFNGLAQVIVQSQRDGSDNLVLRAKAEGLKPAETTISVKATPLYIH
jgi:beta-galactosidase/beta-glucuronidase